MKTDSTSWLNFANRDPGSTITFVATVASGRAQIIIAHPLAGGTSVASSPTNYYSPDPCNTTTGRWTSARTIRTGIRIIPSANIVTK